VRMLQVRRRADLGEETLGADYGRELRSQDFERDFTIVLQVLREIDGRHSARAELALDAVTVSNSRGKAFGVDGFSEAGTTGGAA
jgi:hypothetical protein